MKHRFDYLWIMDDDVLPEFNCLNELLAGMDDSHKVCIPDRTDDNYTDTAVIEYDLNNPFKLTLAQRIKRIPCKEINTNYIDVQAMAFEGPLVDTSIIDKVGLPDSDYFILFDDSDYCRRILKYTNVRLVKSAILHKQIIPSTTHELNWKDSYSYRNGFFYDQKYGRNYFVRKCRPFIFKTFCAWHGGRKYGRIGSDLVKRAYRDAKNNIRGKTFVPGKLGEYLYIEKKENK